jgi:hypothetical protein
MLLVPAQILMIYFSLGLSLELTFSRKNFWSSSLFPEVKFKYVVQAGLYFTISFFAPVFRIHDILVWIRLRILGSIPLTNGSGKFSIKILFCNHYFSPLNTFMRKGKDPGGPKTYGSGCGSRTLLCSLTKKNIFFTANILGWTALHLILIAQTDTILKTRHTAKFRVW